jgi:hypothetical protein
MNTCLKTKTSQRYNQFPKIYRLSYQGKKHPLSRGAVNSYIIF